jgi:hypothetical protein
MFILSVGNIIYNSTLFSCCKSSFRWAYKVDNSTIEHSWGTYVDQHYITQNSVSYTEKEFIKQLKKSSYTDISVEQLLNMNIENHRLKRYRFAKSAEEAYPPSDRPRGDKDINSVNYFLSTCKAISPVTIAIMIDKKGDTRFMKLDGVHRMVAAMILNKNIRVLWIDLRKKY